MPAKLTFTDRDLRVLLVALEDSYEVQTSGDPVHSNLDFNAREYRDTYEFIDESLVDLNRRIFNALGRPENPLVGR